MFIFLFFSTCLLFFGHCHELFNLNVNKYSVAGNGAILFPDNNFNNFNNRRKLDNEEPFDLLKTSNISNVDDFFAFFGIETDDPLKARKKNEEFAVQANCEPELRTIDLDLDDGISNINKDAEVLLFPKCVRVKRCGGCCDVSDRTTCTPIKKTKKSIKRAAIRLKRSFTGTIPEASTLVTTIEVHEECRCICRIKAESCTAMQEYQPEQCRCNCINTEQELKCRNTLNKIWDANECKCKCKEKKYCSTGLVFSQDICSCVRQ